MSDYFEIISVCAFALLIVIAFDLLRFRRKYRQLDIKFRDSEERNAALLATCCELKERIAEQPCFAEDLNQAELSTKFQIPRLDLLRSDSEKSTPERYSYAIRLIEKGMDPETVSSLLAISPQEADQLVSLSRISANH